MTRDIVVRGGAGGTVAVLQSLRHGAGLLRTAAGLLDTAAASARWAEQDGLGPTPTSPASRAHALAELAPVVRGPASLGAHAEGAERLAVALVRAADALERAEDAAGDAMRTALAAAGQHAGDRPLALLAWALVARAAVPAVVAAGAGLHVAGRGPVAARRLGTADLAEHAVQLVAGVVRGLAPGTAPASAAPVVGASGVVLATTGLAAHVAPPLGRRPLRVTAHLGAGSAAPPAWDAAGVLERVGSLYPRAGGTAGTVGVDRVDHLGGTRTWVVSIPGTQDATSFGGGANPMDMATNVRLMATATDDGSELVTRALAQAGARPGEEVLLAGHSQGGMVAMALAGSAAFTARHRVAAVLTAGSPVATRSVPSTTAVLHLEHRQDLVPALDGWRNPDRPHRTTAVRDLSASPLPTDRLAARSPGAAHGVDAYTRTARAVAALGAPSVRAWERSAAPVLGGAGATVVHHEFTGERTPVRRPSGPAAGPTALSPSGSPR